jgi:dihydrofolate synthase/folylpolyglutamate synthase
LATIHTIAEAEAALLPYVPLVSELTGKDTTLMRIRPLMKLLGDPQDQLRIIHVAGTSGKTSTSYYMAALLTATGKKVGLAVSPHVDSITERVQLGGQPLGDEAFCEKLTRFLAIVQAADAQASYFELMYAFGLWVFAEERVDYAVVETGVGGLYDATNVATRADKICIITDIGFDHMRLLGNTLPEIAAQKIGIVHTGNNAFCYRQSNEIMDVFKSWVETHDATLHTTEESDEHKQATFDSDMPDYQQRNWLLAYFCYRYIGKRDALPSLTSEVLQQTQKTRIPGRMDIRMIGDKQLVMDGAHNASKMSAFIESFLSLYPHIKPAVLLAFKKDKEYAELIPMLSKFASTIIVTTFNTSQDLPVVSQDPQLITDEFTKVGALVQAIADNEDALRTLLQQPEAVLVATGSFYLLSQLRKSKLLI